MKSSEEILQDPHAKIKKSGIAVLVVSIGVVALAVFSIFGWLLRDFLIFDSTRIQAERELSRITNEIAEAGVKLKESRTENDALLANEKGRLHKLIKEIADHNETMAGKPKQEREYQELIAKIAQAKNESDKTISAMQQTKEAVVQELARNSALKMDNQTLEREKSNLKDAVSILNGERLALQQQKSALTAEVASLKQQQFSVKGDMEKIQREVTSLKKEVDALTARINNLKKTAPNQ
jgi:chromosome segregation ATPase